ncbi:MAG: SUMF1/EgtB/PvdO family nonheme iron enzyme, partial [Planctomycetota bacterium]|nr:SUMF1/EgtB/PvdO family nonheme iron enzyme [Planctomycetota bacterium]
SNSGFVRHSLREHAEVPNAFGLVDMLGNTREWCSDFFHPDYQDAPINGLPQTRPMSRRHRVIRGGAWNSDAGECRCASRDFRFRRNRQSGAGVRPVFPLAIF